MTDPSNPISRDRTVEVALTSSASLALSEATEVYVQTVIAQARANSGRREVAAEHLERAVRHLSPAYEAAGLRVALDWIKRVGFLIVGIAIAQLGQLLADVGHSKATTDEVIRVVVLILVGAVLVVVAVAMDAPALLNWNAARRLRREISRATNKSA